MVEVRLYSIDFTRVCTVELFRVREYYMQDYLTMRGGTYNPAKLEMAFNFSPVPTAIWRANL